MMVMKKKTSSLLLCAAALATAVAAQGPWQHQRGIQGHRLQPPGRWMTTPPSTGNATFTQLIDHNNPSLGTFEQFYYWSDVLWKGPGSPVVIMTPGEVAAEGYEGYLGNKTLTGAIAQEIGAATIVLEHRYWGFSSPFDSLTTANLQYQTLDNAIQDLVNFAANVELPFTSGGRVDSTASAVPWVLVGGSYSGALTAWTAAKAPGTFWAYVASSAVVEAIDYFWQYFEPVQEGMPKNCSADVSRVVDYADGILMNGTDQQVHDLKAKFGLESVVHNDDFMSALATGPFQWQSTDFTTSAGFFSFCDYVENAVNGTNASLPGADGVGLTKALDGYARWMKTIIPDECQGTDADACYTSYDANSTLYTDTSVDNDADRQWIWFLCNQPFGWWQTGAPVGTPSLISRLITPEYNRRQCGLYFPEGPQGETYGIAQGKTEDQVNAYTGGWFIDNTTRLVYTNGEWDPWRYSTVSSDVRPGGRLESTAQVPVNVIPEGRHCSDLIIANGKRNAGCAAVQQSEISQISQWVKEFPRSYQWTA